MKNANMKKHINYPKIKQFRQVVSDINHSSSFVGLDQDEKPIYNNALKKPVVTFNGTVKLHGTNASFCYNKELGFWTQSRGQIITPESDNGGFSKYAYSIKDELMQLITDISTTQGIDLEESIISVYGEWAGQGIQKGVGISTLEKAFYIFGIKVSAYNDESKDAYWIDYKGFKNEDARVYNMLDFKTYSVDVDFSMPQLSQNVFAEITQDVESECPVAKHFGVDNGLGEGVVWTANYKGNNYRFKVKGQKHSVTKVKKLASVDVEKLKTIQDFAEYAVTENRVNQGIKEIFGDGDLDRSKMGDFLRWIIKDVMSEESDTMTQNGLEAKDVNKYISFRAREMFFKLESIF